MKYRMSQKKRVVFNEPLNNGDIFDFQNLTCFWMSTTNLDFHV